MWVLVRLSWRNCRSFIPLRLTFGPYHEDLASRRSQLQFSSQAKVLWPFAETMEQMKAAELMIYPPSNILPRCRDKLVRDTRGFPMADFPRQTYLDTTKVKGR